MQRRRSVNIVLFIVLHFNFAMHFVLAIGRTYLGVSAKRILSVPLMSTAFLYDAKAASSVTMRELAQTFESLVSYGEARLVLSLAMTPRWIL